MKSDQENWIDKEIAKCKEMIKLGKKERFAKIAIDFWRNLLKEYQKQKANC